MRILVTRCSIRYEGRLVTTLETGDRVVLFKDDGAVVVHAGQGAKPINYMPGPTVVAEEGRTITVSRPSSGESLVIDVEDVHADTAWELEDTAKLVREGREKDIQATIFATPHAIEDGMVGLQRELFTEVGPVDLFCRDTDGRTCVIEVKRVRAVAAAVEQLTRYMEQVDRNVAHAPARGILVAPELAPQARVLLELRGYDFVPLDEVLSRCDGGQDLMRLF
ncbi:MAG: nucS [Thermoleophilia bacterium]|nr:nucS [Thermoleophilia bacterium]